LRKYTEALLEKQRRLVAKTFGQLADSLQACALEALMPVRVLYEASLVVAYTMQ
jgi:hypothetical protein